MEIGKILILLGVSLLIAGIVFTLFAEITWRYIDKKRKFYIPLSNRHLNYYKYHPHHSQHFLQEVTLFDIPKFNI